VRTHVLKVNVNNLKREINNNYFKYKDIFYKCLVVNLCLYNMTKGDILENVIVEDSIYQQYLSYLINKKCALPELLQEIALDTHTYIFLDLNIYIDEFIDMKYDAKKFNLFSLTIDDNGYINVFNKTIRKIC